MRIAKTNCLPATIISGWQGQAEWDRIQGKWHQLVMVSCCPILNYHFLSFFPSFSFLCTFALNWTFSSFICTISSPPLYFTTDRSCWKWHTNSNIQNQQFTQNWTDNQTRTPPNKKTRFWRWIITHKDSLQFRVFRIGGIFLCAGCISGLPYRLSPATVIIQRRS